MDETTIAALKQRLDLSDDVTRASLHHLAKVAHQGDVSAVIAAIETALHYAHNGEERTARWAYEQGGKLSNILTMFDGTYAKFDAAFQGRTILGVMPSTDGNQVLLTLAEEPEP